MFDLEGEPVDSADEAAWLFIRFDHKGVPLAATTFRADHCEIRQETLH